MLQNINLSIKKAIFSSLVLLISGNVLAAVIPTSMFPCRGTEIGRIGVDEENPLDNPTDNIFHVDISKEICGTEIAWLVYELNGVADHTGVARSINDQTAIGGYFVQHEDGWSVQRERVDIDWLNEGDNVVRFTVPANATHSYSIRNLSIELAQPVEVPTRELVINQPKTMGYFNDQGYLKGYVASWSVEKPVVLIDGKEIAVINGEFEYSVKNTSGDEVWHVNIEAIYSDGENLCQEVEFNTKSTLSHRYAIEKGVYFTEKLFTNKLDQSITLGGATLLADSAILDRPTYLSITTLRSVDVAALDAGMVNVTKNNAGYRFLPHGTNFNEEVKLVIGYDKEVIPTGYTEKDIKTYYFDEQTHHWIPLRTDTVMADRGEVVSKTTHFTDYINAIIKVPESPEVNAYNSTSMKGIKAANPTSGINLMQPPSANSMGGASMNYPINIPAGRNGMQPQLALSYNNGGGNGWLGLGWNLTLPSVNIDTRWGVPRYDPAKETETYSLTGQQLTPVAHRGEQPTREANKQFYPRVEGAFNKIIRKGNSTSNYWWEVTDKNGTVYTYGKDDTAVLIDGNGNRAYWALQEVKDLNGNYVTYHYTKQQDSGLGDGTGGVQGSQLYISKIVYTNHASAAGKYSVHFYRDRDLGVPRRQDVSIDARLGFKQVTADLLKRIEVKFEGVDAGLDEKNIRHYELNYEQGAFFKTLLTSINEHDAAGALFTTHTMEYFDDVQANNGYVPYSGQETWNTQLDDLNGGFLNIEDLNDKASALSGTNSKTGGGGSAITIGPSDYNVAAKTNTVGMNFDFSHTESLGRLTIIDLNGDGLSDKVMVFADGIGGLNKTFKYRPQLPPSSDGIVTYGDLVTIDELDEFLREKSNSFSVGLESNFGVFVGNNLSFSKSKTTVYFSDVNGDGLPDIVRNGTVYFNRLNDEGHPEFLTTSGGTPNSLLPGGTVDPNLIEEDPQELENLIDQNPLHDVVRMWRAPHTGIISVNSTVKLIEDISQDRIDYTSADGVKASIQLRGNQILWEETIKAEDYGDNNFNKSGINVQKGDRIYFRLQSRYDGAYDQVTWNPTITYTNHASTETDANGLDLYRFNASEDYVITSRQRIGAPIDGKLHIEGLFTKPITSDCVTVEILRGDNEVLLRKKYNWNEEVSDDLVRNIDVIKEEQLRFKVTTSSNIDWKQISWQPYLYYTASYDPEHPHVFDKKGKPMIAMHAVPEYSLYAKEFTKTTVWEVEEDDTVSITKDFTSKAVEYGEIAMTIKRENELLSKQLFTIEDTIITKTEGDTIYQALPVKAGDKIFIELHTPQRRLASKLRNSTAEVNFSNADKDSLVIDVGLYTSIHEDEWIFGPMYRNWGMFIYNGNRGRADNTIVEGELNMNQYNTETPSAVNLEGATNNDEIESSFDTQGGYRANEENFIMMVASGSQQHWRGSDEFTYIADDTVSSSRMGIDQLESMLVVPEIGAGASAIDKITKSTSVSFALSAGLGFSESIGTSKVVTDFMDMNGDRYPDILSEKKIQYTLPAGGLEESARTHGWKFNHFTNTDSHGITIGGGFPKSEQQASNSSKTGMFAAIGESVSLSASGLTSNDSAEYSWIDINGDGLPDRVNAVDNTVSLNLGYSFSTPEFWGDLEVRVGTALNGSVGIGVSLFNKSIQAGVGYSRSVNNTLQMLHDVNGDGLPDKVFLDTDKKIRVEVNTGNGFYPLLNPWGVNKEANKGVTSTMSANVAFTIGIPIYLVKLAINPKVNTSQSFNRQEIQISDIDGDGFPDYLSSDSDDILKVKRSTIGRTNMLKTVHRPLGASFTLDYHREGNTYELSSPEIRLQVKS